MEARCLTSAIIKLPSGCILLPSLFTLHIKLSLKNNCTMIKYADHAVLIGLLADDVKSYCAEKLTTYKTGTQITIIFKNKENKRI